MVAAAPRRALAAGALGCAALLLPACGEDRSRASRPGPGTGTSPEHVFIVVEENADFARVIGSPSMPYLNGLAQEYGLATQFYANTHPSIGNYFELATGQIISNNDSYSTIVTVDNIVRRLLAGGKTWKSFAEDLPSVGYIGGDRKSTR